MPRAGSPRRHCPAEDKNAYGGGNMDRRDFLKSATLATAATATAGGTIAAADPATDTLLAQGGGSAAAKSAGEPRMRRWTEQRWALDNVIRANGMDWDQPRSVYLSAPCGPEAGADFAAIRGRIQKFAD